MKEWLSLTLTPNLLGLKYRFGIKCPVINLIIQLLNWYRSILVFYIYNVFFRLVGPDLKSPIALNKWQFKLIDTNNL